MILFGKLVLILVCSFVLGVSVWVLVLFCVFRGSGCVWIVFIILYFLLIC